MCHNSLSKPCPHLVRWLMGISIIGLPITTLLTMLLRFSPPLASHPENISRPKQICLEQMSKTSAANMSTRWLLARSPLLLVQNKYCGRGLAWHWQLIICNLRFNMFGSMRKHFKKAIKPWNGRFGTYIKCQYEGKYKKNPIKLAALLEEYLEEFKKYWRNMKD